MNIALMAHDNRKELMVQFCTASAPPPAPASRSPTLPG